MRILTRRETPVLYREAVVSPEDCWSLSSLAFGLLSQAPANGCQVLETQILSGRLKSWPWFQVFAGFLSR